MTTITTGHQRTPLVAALAVGAALVVGGAIGVAWEQHNDTPPAAATQSQPITASSFGGATTSQEISGAVDGHLSQPTPFGGATTGQESTR
jgi:hypothetical protein